MIITLQGEPRSTNNLYRNTCRGRFSTTYMTPQGKALKQAYQWEAKAQWKRNPLKGDVDVVVTMYFSRKGKHDFDNFNKLWADALTGIVWEDDSQVADFHKKKFQYDKTNPRIEITIV